MSREEIVITLNKILEIDFEIDPSLLKPEALLREDLGLDSLDGVDLIVAIEKKFGLRVNEAEARSMRAVNDICNSIDTHLNGQVEGNTPTTKLFTGSTIYIHEALDV
jgi:acyl carrier protein